jgi:hypothetical protein
MLFHAQTLFYARLEREYLCSRDMTCLLTVQWTIPLQGNHGCERMSWNHSAHQGWNHQNLIFSRFSTAVESVSQCCHRWYASLKREFVSLLWSIPCRLIKPWKGSCIVFSPPGEQTCCPLQLVPPHFVKIHKVSEHRVYAVKRISQNCLDVALRSTDEGGPLWCWGYNTLFPSQPAR